jgi:hypothetical protein
MPQISTLKKKKVAAPKPRNANTMSEAAFWGWIRAGLRKRSMYWKPIRNALLEVQRAYSGPNPRQKWEYQCHDCKRWFPKKEVEVDHIIEAGSLKCAEDLPGFVERLFCEQENLQVRCHHCHDLKTHSK